MYARFDTTNKVLVDEQGIQLCKDDVEALMNECLDHLGHSDLELMALGRLSVETRHPSMVSQFNFAEYYP